MNRGGLNVIRDYRGRECGWRIVDEDGNTLREGAARWRGYAWDGPDDEDYAAARRAQEAGP